MQKGYLDSGCGSRSWWNRMACVRYTFYELQVYWTDEVVSLPLHVCPDVECWRWSGNDEFLIWAIKTNICIKIMI